MPSGCSGAPSGSIGSKGPGSILTRCGVSGHDLWLSPFPPCPRGPAPCRALRGLEARGGVRGEMVMRCPSEQGCPLEYSAGPLGTQRISVELGCIH